MSTANLEFVENSANHHEASLMYVIGRVNHAIRREMRARLAKWSLSVQEYTTLSVLSSRPGLSNAQLARRALVTPQTMIEILAKLERRGLVERGPDPSHRLILRAELTRDGHELLSEADRAVQEIQARMLASVSEREQQVAARAMRKAMENLSGPSANRTGR
jgi:DNA-binding MarR family transcriptional regulator